MLVSKTLLQPGPRILPGVLVWVSFEQFPTNFVQNLKDFDDILITQTLPTQQGAAGDLAAWRHQ